MAPPAGIGVVTVVVMADDVEEGGDPVVLLRGDVFVVVGDNEAR